MQGCDKGTTDKNEVEDKEIEVDEGMERMHARMRLEGNKREVDREIWRKKLRGIEAERG